jgi:hypothetical protein
MMISLDFGQIISAIIMAGATIFSAVYAAKKIIKVIVNKQTGAVNGSNNNTYNTIVYKGRDEENDKSN